MKEAINKIYIKNKSVFNTEEFDDFYLKSGKSLYEVIKVIEKIPLFLEEHLDRLYNSSKLANLNITYSRSEIEEIILNLIEKNNQNIGNVKLVFNFDAQGMNFLAFFIKHNYPSEEDYKIGVDTILYEAERENPNAKIINYDFKSKVEEKIKTSKVYEAILVNKEGNITEGSRSNMFFVKNNIVITSPIDKVLPGITRGTILSLCENLNIKVEESAISIKELDKIQGAFLSGTSPNALPIKRINSMEYDSSENVVINKIVNGFNEMVKNYIEKKKNT